MKPKPKQINEIYFTCETFLPGHPFISLSEKLDLLSQYTANTNWDQDVYGTGKSLNKFEQKVADTFGYESAIFMPSGAMAQQIALRIWSEKKNNFSVAFHPTCQLELNEHHAYQFLHGMKAHLIGEMNQVLSAKEIETLPHEISALLYELPMRQIGGDLPTWEELEKIKSLAKLKSFYLHLDGARVWETAPYYKKTYQEICAGFDSAYVSFYKILGNLSGAMLMGPKDFIEQSKIWLRRHGGNLYTLSPLAASAEMCLEKRLPQIPEYIGRAQQIFQILKDQGLKLVPEFPQTNMCHIHFPYSKEKLELARNKIAEEEKFWLFGGFNELPGGRAKTELTIASNALPVSDTLLEEVVQKFLAILKT